MKFLIIALLCVCMACTHVSKIFSNSASNKEVINSEGDTILIGKCSPYLIKSGRQKEWFDQAYNNYVVDSVTVDYIRPLIGGKRIQVFLGSWCSDSRRQVPKVMKILEMAGMDTSNISLVFLD